MSIMNGRLDIHAINPVVGESNKWDIEATFIDNTGIFYAFDVHINDVIYIDCSAISLGAIRFKVAAIDPLTTETTLKCTIQWDLTDTQPSDWSVYDYPTPGNEAIVGKSNALGAMEVPSITVNLLDEYFITAVRNVETKRLAQSVQSGSGLPVCSFDDQVLIGNADNTVYWSSEIDQGTF